MEIVNFIKVWFAHTVKRTHMWGAWETIYTSDSEIVGHRRRCLDCHRVQEDS